MRYADWSIETLKSNIEHKKSERGSSQSSLDGLLETTKGKDISKMVFDLYFAGSEGPQTVDAEYYLDHLKRNIEEHTAVYSSLPFVFEC